jgi:hypothetical protein
MPYIDPERRDYLDRYLQDPVLPAETASEGDLNYMLTRIVLAWLGSPVSYASINTAIGVLECMKLELYRRVAAPYEDDKRDLNGEVYL